MGAGARLREAFPDVVVAAAEPLPGDPVMGLRSLEDGYVPPILDVSKLDRKVLVSNAESVAGAARAARRRGDLRRRLLGRRRPRRAQARGRARRGRRRLRARRRRLEVPLGRLLGRATTSSSRWSAPSGGDPRRRARGARASTRATEAPNEACGLLVLRDGVRRALRARAGTPPTRRTASSSRSTPRRGSSRTRATSSRSSTRTRRARRARRGRTSRTSASGRAAVRDPRRFDRRPRRLHDRGRPDLGPSRWLPSRGGASRGSAHADPRPLGT